MTTLLVKTMVKTIVKTIAKTTVKTMATIACICLLLFGLVACSPDDDTASRQIATQGVNDGSNDPYYQLQEAEARKHKDSAPPASQ